MKTIQTIGFFDNEGKIEIENQPLLKNKKVKLLIIVEEDDDKDFYTLSEQVLSTAYSNDEPEYTASLIKEPNPNYGGR